MRRLTYFFALALAATALASAAQAARTMPLDKTATPAATGVAVGKKAPDFTLTDIGGKQHKLSEYTKAGDVVVLEWFNPQCPFVRKYRESSTFMNDTSAAFKGKKVVWLAIDSSAAGKEGSDPQVISAFVKDNAMSVPVLLDGDGKVGHAYGAVTTPHIFVISAKGTLVYKGAPDTSTAMDRTPKGDNLVKAAVEAALAGKTPAVTETKPIGCSVKYA